MFKILEVVEVDSPFYHFKGIQFLDGEFETLEEAKKHIKTSAEEGSNPSNFTIVEVHDFQIQVK